MNDTRKRILVATDFSAGSDRALAEAVTLAKAAGATIELVHVMELPMQEFPLGLGFYSFEAGGYLAYATKELETRAEGVRAAGVACETRSLEGRASVEIVRRAEETGADMIVVGTQGRTGLAHVLVGSVAERVVRHAGRPVLTVPVRRGTP